MKLIEKQGHSLRNKNLLPLLAITAMVLSVSLANYNSPRILNSTQSVLSDSDEKNNEDSKEVQKSEEKNEEKSENSKNEDRKEVKNETNSRGSGSTVTGKNEAKRATEKPKVKLEIIEVEDLDGDEVKDESGDVNKIDNEVENEIETEFEQESETASADGTVSKFKLKLKTRTVAGKTVVETEAGEIEVESNPEDTINNLVTDGLLDTPISFEAKTNDNNKVEFEIQGTESKKFLGIVNVVIPKIITVSSETGEVVSTNQNFWSRILSLLSI